MAAEHPFYILAGTLWEPHERSPDAALEGKKGSDCDHACLPSMKCMLIRYLLALNSERSCPEEIAYAKSKPERQIAKNTCFLMWRIQIH